MRRGLLVTLGLAGVLGAAAAAVVFAGPANAVADGYPVSPGHYRFSVKLTMTHIPNPDGTFRDSACSASLVSRRWIITAGHCFHDVNRNRVSGPVPYPTMATVGRTTVSGTGGHDVSVIWVQQSPSTDIALGELATPIDDVAPLGLSTRTPKTGDVLRITGWGATSSVNPTPSDQLRTGQVKISSVSSGTVGVVGYQPKPTTSACLYDSGAPYFRERDGRPPLLVGVESDGPDCPHHLEETTSRVDNIVNWIHRVIGG